MTTSRGGTGIKINIRSKRIVSGVVTAKRRFTFLLFFLCKGILFYFPAFLVEGEIFCIGVIFTVNGHAKSKWVFF